MNIERGNIIWKYVRARLYAVADVPRDLATLKSFPLRVVSTADLMADAVSIALTYGICAIVTVNIEAIAKLN